MFQVDYNPLIRTIDPNFLKYSKGVDLASWMVGCVGVPTWSKQPQRMKPIRYDVTLFFLKLVKVEKAALFNFGRKLFICPWRWWWVFWIHLNVIKGEKPCSLNWHICMKKSLCLPAKLWCAENNSKIDVGAWIPPQGDRLGMTRAWIGHVIFSRPQNIPWVANRLRGLPLCPSVKALLWLGQWMMHISWMQCSIKATDSILRWVQGVLKGLHQLGCGICLLVMFRNKDLVQERVFFWC